MVVRADARRVTGDVPCLVVTGDIDTAKRRLAEPDEAAADAIIAEEFDPRDLDAPLVPRLIAAPTFGAIERAAREAQAQHVAWMREQGAQPRRATTWASLDDRSHDGQ